MIFPGDEWKEEQSKCPTTADILKYYATGARLLLEPQNCYGGPKEVVISDVANGGELFLAGQDDKYRPAEWFKAKDVLVLAVLPPLYTPPPAPTEQSEPRRRLSWREKLAYIKYFAFRA